MQIDGLGHAGKPDAELPDILVIDLFRDGSACDPHDGHPLGNHQRHPEYLDEGLVVVQRGNSIPNFVLSAIIPSVKIKK
jgi:hypothetical protein